MGRTGGSLSVSLGVLAAAQLLFNPLGHAQEPAPAPPVQPQSEPQVQVQGQPAQDPNPAPPPYAPPYAPPYPPPVYGPIVTLRADSPRARLQMQTALRWQDICLTPCNVPVSPAGVYRVGGGTIRASESFNMPRPSGQVLIDAQVGSKVKRGVGIGLTIGGAVAAAAGGVYLLAAAGSSNDGFTNTQDAFTVVGVTYLVIGVVLLAVGIPLSASSTSVTVR
jgi:hypothetical protein